jgi:signal transduction histidine kinase
MYQEEERVMDNVVMINNHVRRQKGFPEYYNGKEKLYAAYDALLEPIIIYKNYKIDFMNFEAVKLIKALNCNTAVEKISEELINLYDDLKMGSGYMFYGFTKHIKKLQILTDNKKKLNLYMVITPIIIRDELCIMTFLSLSNPMEKTPGKEVSPEISGTSSSRSFEDFKSELVNILSHELRTPLNTILGSLQLLQRGISEEGHMKRNPQNLNGYLNFIKANSYRLLRISNNFLDIANVNLGLEELSIRKYDIVEVAKSIVRFSMRAANRKGINLLLATNVESKIMAIDRSKIEKVILNLISNSIKFSEENGKIILMVIAKEDGVKVSVIDEGIGIPSDKLDKIFDGFSQIDRSLSRSNEGIGIGLTLVKAFVELHSGSLKVRSEAGKGSWFTFELPVGDLGKYEDGFNYIDDDNIREKIELEFSDI